MLKTSDTPTPLPTPDPGDGEVFIKDSRNTKSGKYSKENISKVIQAAKAIGVDPYEALSIALQESGFGKTASKTTEESGSRRNRAGIGNVTSPLSDKEMEYLNGLAGKGLDMGALKMAYILKQKNNDAKSSGFDSSDALRLQGYQGWAKKFTREMNGGSDRILGVPIGDGLNLIQNPVTGSRLVQLREDLKKNKDIQGLFTNPYVAPKKQRAPVASTMLPTSEWGNALAKMGLGQPNSLAAR